MKIRLMQIIDTYIGLPLCHFLNFVYSVKNNLRNQNHLDKKKVQKILLMKFWGMGSILLITPTIQAIKKKYPDSQITFLTFDENKDFIRLIKSIDDYIFMSKKHFLTFIVRIPLLILKIRREKFDLLIDFEFFTRFTSIVSLISGTSIKVGFHNEEIQRCNAYTFTTPFILEKHVTENFLSLVEEIGCQTNEIVFEKPMITEDTINSINTKLMNNGIKPDGQIIMVNINSSYLSYERRWPLEYFVELINKIINSHNITIICIGSKNEREYVQKCCDLLDQKDKVFNFAGDLTIEELCALLTRSLLLITNDSGPLHFAAVLEVPTISFFGPETPVLYGPIGNNHVVFFKDIYCSPCLRVFTNKTSRCTIHAKCMKEITVQEVYESFIHLLGNVAG